MKASLALMALCLTGCATVKEPDPTDKAWAEIRKECESPDIGGCVILPQFLFDELLRRLHSNGMI